MNWLKHPIFTRFSLFCLIGIVTLALGMGAALSALLTRAVSEWEWQNTAALVRREVEREGLQRVFTEPGGPGTRQRWGRVLSATMTSLPEIVRVKVWDREHEILWSDQTSLIGQRFFGNDELQRALAGAVEVEIKRLGKSEQRYERPKFGTLAEVYVPIFAADGRVLGVGEVEKTPDRLLNTIRWSRMIIWAISLTGGAMLYLVLLPLLMQMYRRQVEEEMLRQHAARLEEQVEQRTQQFMQAQKMQALGLLAGGIAHDFNNMLTVIFGRAQILLARLPNSARAREDADAIGEAAERAAALTRQLLAFSRKQRLERRTMDLNTAIVDMAKMLHRLIGANISVITPPSRSAGWVNVERARAEQAATSTPRTGWETILVAEDDPAVRTLASDMLREHGYTVLTAADGDEALQLAERHGARIHLLLTDVMMPRMNGLQLAGSFTAIRPEARVLYMTGYAEMPPVSDAAIVQKPFTMFALMEAVRRTLERSERNGYVVSPA